MSQFFKFIIFQGYNKFSLELQSKMQKNITVSENLWCTGYRSWSESLLGLFIEVFGNHWIITDVSSYSGWNYQFKESLLSFCKMSYCFPLPACSFISLMAALTESSLVAFVSKGIILCICAKKSDKNRNKKKSQQLNTFRKRRTLQSMTMFHDAVIYFTEQNICH